jgi:hypothetical protein
MKILKTKIAIILFVLGSYSYIALCEPRDSLIIVNKSKLLLELKDSGRSQKPDYVLFIKRRSADTIIKGSSAKDIYKFDSISFRIRKGRLMNTVAFLRDSSKIVIFYNNDKVTLTKKKLEEKFSDYKLKDYIGSTEQINLRDFFYFEKNLNYNGDDFYPTDTTVTFSKKNKNIIVGVYSSRRDFGNFIEFDMLSDIQGLNNDSPNGLIQFEGRASFTLNRRYFCGSNFRFFYNIIPFIQFNKIDENNRNLPVLKDTINNTKYLNTVNLWQYSNLTFGIKINILRWNSNNYRINGFIDASSMIIRTSISDSTPKISNYNVNSFIGGVALKLRVQPFDNSPFLGDFSIGINNLTLLNQNIKQQSGYMYRANNDATPSNNNYKFKDKFLFVPQAEISFKPSKTKYFVRTSFPSDLTKTGNNFLQIQFGISLSPDELNKYLNVKK